MVVIMLSGLKGGAQIITLPKFEQDSFVKTLDTEKVINYLIRIQHLVYLRFNKLYLFSFKERFETILKYIFSKFPLHLICT